MINKIIRKLKKCVDCRKFEYEKELKDSIYKDCPHRISYDFIFNNDYCCDIKEVINEFNFTQDEWDFIEQEAEIKFKYEDMVHKLVTEIAEEQGYKLYYDRGECIIYLN